MLRNIRTPYCIRARVVTIAFLFCLKGVGNRAFYRWLERDYTDSFPPLAGADKAFSIISFASTKDRVNFWQIRRLVTLKKLIF